MNIRCHNLLFVAVFLQVCDLLATLTILHLGGTELNPFIGTNPTVTRLSVFKLIAVALFIFLAMTEKGCGGLYYLNIIVGTVVIYSLVSLAVGTAI